MTILLGIIFFHFLVIFRAKFSEKDTIPYLSTFIMTALLVAYVVAMLFSMSPPEQ
ncbi:MAG: hypothetical protein WD381_04680 [Balneolaceae bacterium]